MVVGCSRRKRRKEGRKEYCEAEKRRHSECNPRTDCFQILMSRDLLYPRRVRAAEWAGVSPSNRAARRRQPPLPPQHHHPRRWEATVDELCIVAVELACLSLIVKFFAAHSGPFYRLTVDRRKGKKEKETEEWEEKSWGLMSTSMAAVKVAGMRKKDRGYTGISMETRELRGNTRARRGF